MQDSSAINGVAAGVPFVALPPENAAGDAPLIVTWHLMDPPASEAAMAAAVPMAGVQAWRVYLGLPLSGARLPEGGFEEFFRLASEDAVLNVYGPVNEQAAAEFPAALAALRDQLAISDGPIGIAGGSAGSAVAYEVIARAEVPIAAAAVVSPVTQLAPVIVANARRFGITYTWTEESRGVAERYDFVRRADEIKVPLLLVVGENDDVAFREPAALLHKELAGSELVTIPGMEHTLAEEPGLEPAPQNADALRVDAAFTEWFQRHL